MMVSKTEMVNESIFKQSTFSMDVLGDEVFQGWSDGTLWNGWDTPMFEFDEAKRLVEALISANEQMGYPIQAWYDEEEDSFCFVLEARSEPECYPSMVIEVDGREVKGYSIGAFAWVWEEVPAE